MRFLSKSLLLEKNDHEIEYRQTAIATCYQFVILLSRYAPIVGLVTGRIPRSVHDSGIPGDRVVVVLATSAMHSAIDRTCSRALFLVDWSAYRCGRRTTNRAVRVFRSGVAIKAMRDEYERGGNGKLVADQLGHSLDVNQGEYTPSPAENRQVAVNQLEKSLGVM